MSLGVARGLKKSKKFRRLLKHYFDLQHNGSKSRKQLCLQLNHRTHGQMFAAYCGNERYISLGVMNGGHPSPAPLEISRIVARLVRISSPSLNRRTASSILSTFPILLNPLPASLTILIQDKPNGSILSIGLFSTYA